MNFRKFLIICVCNILFHGSYGKKLYHASSPPLDEINIKEKKGFNMYPNNNLNDERFQTTPNKLSLSENKDPTSNLESPHYKTLEMEIGDHLVQVKSEKVSKSLGSAPIGGGYEISVNPKFSHIIDIVHRGNKFEKQDKLTQTRDDTVENHNLESTKPPNSEKIKVSENIVDPEEYVDLDQEEFAEDEDDAEGFAEDDRGETEDFSDDEDSEEFSDQEGDSEEFFEDGDTEEFAEDEDEELSEDEGNPDEIDELEKKGSKPYQPNVIESNQFVEWNNNAKQNGTYNEQVAVDKESSFSEDFEGSGGEFSDASSLNTTKTGRILGMFSRQNVTFPICTTPKGEAGHCRRLGECLLSEALNNFNGFLQQLCLIRGALVGICCPDNPVIETVNPDENLTTELKSEDIKQPPEGCGLNTKTRIVGGTISVPHEWTWMVALMRRNRFYCGGVIINNWYILTAAHCVMGMNVKDLTVRLGEYDFSEQSKHTEDLSVSEIKRHAQFVTLTFQHDIALLKLKQSIKYSKYIGSICLPDEKARDYSDAKGTVVGWGTVSFGGAASPVLRQVTVPVWKNEDCDKTYMLERIGDSFMCAGSPENGEDACQGDSGGPLMTVTEGGRWEVIGLVSWGRRCGDPTYPGVYTRVTTYLDWIKQNAN